MGIEAPPRAQYIRTILTELSRIATFLLFLGEMGLQVGAITPAFYGFRDREYVLNLIEAVTGGRFHPNFNRIGGLKDDLPWGWISECRSDDAARCSTSCDEFENLVRRQPDLRAAHPLDRHHPAPSSAPRTACRARTCARRGVDWDLRRDGNPLPRRTTSSTGRSGRTPTATRSRATGCGCRRRVSRRAWCCSCSSRCRAARSWRRCRASSRCPRARCWVNTENPLGEMGYYIVSKGATGPFRAKIRSRVVQQRVDPAVDAARRVRARHHHDPREPLLHPRGHRPVTHRARARRSGGGRRSRSRR